MKGLKGIKDMLKTSNKALTELEKQQVLFDKTIDVSINSLDEESRKKMIKFRADAKRVISKAKTGDSSFDELLDKMKNDFKKTD